MERKEESVLIVGLAKDVDSFLVEEISSLRDSFQDFSKVGFLIIESDSKDETISVLNSLKITVQDFHFISLGVLADQIPNRVDRITHCRNVYLDQIENNPVYADFEIVAIADLDGVNRNLSSNAVLSCWERSDWAACAANQSAPYYDIYALRHPSWSPNDCWVYESELRAQGLNPVSAREKAVYSRQITINPNQPWIEVDSAFGGLCIYKRKAIAGARYLSYTAEGTPVCEHVEFHRQIKLNGGKIFINPKLINSGWNIHSSSKRFHKYLKRRVKLLIWLSSSKFRARGF